MPLVYEIKMRDGERVVCDACQYPAPVAEFSPKPLSSDREPRHFCEFCATTFVSNTHDYPTQYSDGASAQAIAHAFNALVDGLGADRSKMWRKV